MGNTAQKRTPKNTTRCSICHATGHNKRTHGRQTSPTTQNPTAKPAAQTKTVTAETTPQTVPTAHPVEQTSTVEGAAGKTHELLGKRTSHSEGVKRKVKLSELVKTSRAEWLADNPGAQTLANPFRYQPEALIRQPGTNRPDWAIGAEGLVDGDCYFCGESFYECESGTCEYGKNPHLVHSTEECSTKMRNITTHPCEKKETFDPWDYENYDEDDDGKDFWD